MSAKYGLFGVLMIIAIDRAIQNWEIAFADFGDIRSYTAKDLRPAHVQDADILVVRTVTPVNASLLEGSSIRFVVAASAGTDHVDHEYLKARGIRFAYAAGCNANSVSEYISVVLHRIASCKGWTLKDKSIAVIGVGNVGSRVAEKARALEMNVLLCDPPLRDSMGDPQYGFIEDVLDADILSFHVPLTCDGPYPTHHMVDSRFLERLSPSQFLINSSRGAVFESRAVKAALVERRIEGVAIDVWEGEPGIDYSLLELADIGTPHIAGNSLDGKITAAEMTREALFRYLGKPLGQPMKAVYPENRILRPEPGISPQDSVLSVLLQAFDVCREDEDLRALQGATNEKAAESFERLRTRRPLRPEFCHFTVDLDKRHIHLASVFKDLGFRIRQAVKQE